MLRCKLHFFGGSYKGSKMLRPAYMVASDQPKAADCDLAAKTAWNTNLKSIYRDLAQQWRDWPSKLKF